MIRHIVFFKQKTDVSREDFEAAVLGLKPLDQQIPEIKSWWLEFGPAGERTVEAALISEFETLEDLDSYQVHPAHTEAASKIGAVATTSIFDAEI